MNASTFARKKLARPNKLQRYSENFNSRNVMEPQKPGYDQMPGNWRTVFFENQNPITIELACGWGEYTIALGSLFPNQNFVGIDMKGDRIWKGSQLANEANLKNVGFLRSRVELLPEVFGPREVDEIWLTFPDPRPKDRDEKHRLNNPYFMNMYRSILQDEGWFRFKTDNTELFEYGLEVLEQMPVRDLEMTRDLYRSNLLSDHHGVKTKYEKIWTNKGEKIKYLKCRFET